MKSLKLPPPIEHLKQSWNLPSPVQLLNVNEHFIERQDSSTELCRVSQDSLTELNRGSDLDRFADPPLRAQVIYLQEFGLPAFPSQPS